MKRKSILAVTVALTIAMTSTACMAAKGLSKQDLQIKESTVAEDTSRKKADKKIPKEFAGAIKMLDNVRDFEVPYWGGYDLRDKQVVFFSDENKKAVIWNVGGNGKTEVVNKSDIPEEKTMSSFADGKFKGKDTVFVMHEADDKMAFVLAVHEGYHFYGQDWINKIDFKNYIPRGTVYPENIEARYYLNEADSRLRDKISGKNKNGDSESLYYYNKLKKEQKDDLAGNLNTSLAEGTANFIENMFLAVALKPELKGDLTAVAKYAYEINQDNLSGSIRDKGQEFYHVSSVGLYYTAMMGEQSKIEQVAKGIHAFELLEDFTKEKKAEDNKDLKEEVYKYYKEINESVSAKIENLYKTMKSKDYAEIRIKSELFPGSMQFGEFINFKVKDEYRTLNTSTSATANLDGNGKIELKDQDTINSDDYMYFIAYAPKSMLKEKDGLLNIKTENLIVENVKFTKKGNSYVIDK